MSENTSKRRGDILALIAYLLLAIALTYPLVLHFATHVAGDGSDDPALAWNLWWVPFSILNLQRSPIYTDYMFYPIGLNLAFYTLTYLNAFLSIPFQFAFNLVVATNTNLLLSFTLSGFGTYLLVKWLVRDWRLETPARAPLGGAWLCGASVGDGEAPLWGWAIWSSAFVAGVVYAFSSNKMLYASLGQFNIASSHWIPFYVLFLLKLFPLSSTSSVISREPLDSARGKLRDREISISEHEISRCARNDGTLRNQPSPALRLGLLLGLFLVFQALSEFIFASFLIIFTALYLVYWVARRFMTGRQGAFRAEAAAHGEPPKATEQSSAVAEIASSSRPFYFASLRSGCGTLRNPGTARQGRRDRYANSILGLIVAVVVFVVFMAPILAAMIQDMRVEGDFMQSGLGFADTFSSNLLGFFVPSHLHPWFGGLEQQFHFAYTNFAYLGLVALGLALLALCKISSARPWGAFGAIFVLISLGPVLQVDGRSFDLPLPFDLLLDIPFIKGNRYPSRWSVMVTLCLAVLVGYGVLWISQKFKVKRQKGERETPPDRAGQVAGETQNVERRTVSRVSRFSASSRAPGAFPLDSAGQVAAVVFPLLPFAFCLLILFEHLSVLPLSNFQVPAVYDTIAQDRGDFTVLEVPLAWRNGFRMTGTLDQAMMFAQWYQTVQRHPILGGNTSRNPELKFQYFTEAPVLNSLIAVETGETLDAATLQRDRELAGPVLRFFGVRYVVWHSPRDPANRAALDAARAYVEQVLPVTKFYDQVYETGETVGYRVREDASALPSTLRADDPQARLYFAEGWGTLGGTAVWATRNQATLLIPRDGIPRGDLSAPGTPISFRLYAPMQNQTAQVTVNEQAVGSLALQQGWGEYSLPVPEKLWRVGVNRVSLQFSRLVETASLRDGDFAIGKTGVTAPASIVVRSAGNQVGDFAHVFVNGVEAALGQRGYNIVVMDASTGHIDASAAFDTFDSESESVRLAQFVSEIPAGKIVAVAARDEISRHLTPGAVVALGSIGATQDLTGKWRWSHAILGVKGAPPGSALQAASETMPAQLVVGIGAMEPNVAAALEWVKVGK